MANLALPKHEIDFLRSHQACSEAVNWLAAGQFASLDAAWQVCQRGDWMIWLLSAANDLDAATWRHLTVDFAEQVRHLLTDERSRAALDVARRYADGLATGEELAAAADDAWAAADAARTAAWAAQADIIRARVPHAPTRIR